MTDEGSPKKAWARCPACSTVYPNIQIAKDGHRLNCPHDMQLKIEKLEKRIGELGGNLEDITADPGLDFTGVEDDEPVEESKYANEDVVSRPDGPVTEWDDEDEEPSTVSALR